MEIKIDPEVIRHEGKEMLEDLVTAAVSEGLKKSKEMAASKMGSVVGALGTFGLGL